VLPIRARRVLVVVCEAIQHLTYRRLPTLQRMHVSAVGMILLTSWSLRQWQWKKNLHLRVAVMDRLLQVAIAQSLRTPTRN